VDLFYLTGLDVSSGRLLVSSEKTELFVDGRYIDIARKKAPCAVFLPEELRKHISRGSEVAFDSSFLSYDGYLQLQTTFPDQKWRPVSKPLKFLRMIKEPQEINALRRAAQLTGEGYLHIAGLLKEGVSEEELSLEFEFFCRRNGASSLSFAPIIAFGENSAYPHHRAGRDCLKKNQIVLFDLGAVVDGYAGDMTRVVFFGNGDPQLLKDYELIQSVQKKVIEHVAPGIRFGELDRIARSCLEEAGVASLFTHGLSHGIGLDVHEYPRLGINGGDVDLILTPGMCFTVEPGIYRTGLGGVRYEDVVIVTNAGHETL
jgi:Xaa-Pro aminopeptidase